MPTTSSHHWCHLTVLRRLRTPSGWQLHTTNGPAQAVPERSIAGASAGILSVRLKRRQES